MELLPTLSVSTVTAFAGIANTIALSSKARQSMIEIVFLCISKLPFHKKLLLNVRFLPYLKKKRERNSSYSKSLFIPILII